MTRPRSSPAPARVHRLLRTALTLLAGAALSHASPAPPTVVRLCRTPHEGLQPQAAVDARDRVHLVYFQGEPAGGNLFYVRSDAGHTNFSRPIQINTAESRAVALGSIRGAQLALGPNDRPHVLWSGSRPLTNRPYAGVPLFYTRLDDKGEAFEPPRDLLQTGGNLDGGASVAADASNRVAIFWHGAETDRPPGEAQRAVFHRISRDGGLSFGPEEPLPGIPRGVCACCSLRGFLARDGTLSLFYRSARTATERDGMFVSAPRSGEPFRVRATFPWTASACPMSSATIIPAADGLWLAGESSNQVWLAFFDPRAAAPKPAVFPKGETTRKHPSAAVGIDGTMLLAWIEGSGWARGGTLGWQLFRPSGEDASEPTQGPAIPAWSFPAAVARRDGTFLLFH